MDIYQMTLDYLVNLHQSREWPELWELMKDVSSHHPVHWQLPIIACEAVGGETAQVIPGMAAVACLHTSIILIDDMLDEDPKGIYHQLGAPATANFASALQALGLEAIAQSDNDRAVKLPTIKSLNQTALTTALGQYWDTQGAQDEITYWRIVHAKSAPFFEASLYMGALLGGASEDLAQQLGQLGSLYGEMIQIHDDLSDSMAVPANPDWLKTRATLPILFAQVVHHPERECFLALRKAIPDPDALAQAQSILIRCGAISYAIDQLIRRYRRAQSILAETNLERPDTLDRLFSSVIMPVKELLQMAGAPEPDSLLTKWILAQPDRGEE